MKIKIFITQFFTVLNLLTYSQIIYFTGTVTDGDNPVSGALIEDIISGKQLQTTRPNGKFLFKMDLKASEFAPVFLFSKEGYSSREVKPKIANVDTIVMNVTLAFTGETLDEVVVSASLKPIEKSTSEVPVSTLNSEIFRRVSTPLLMDALPMLPGIRLHYDCNVCEAPSLRINGLPGPYTLIVIDGMPIMGALASTYGLFGLNSGLILRTEVTRGPGSVLFGTEALGGVVNVITLHAERAPRVYIEQLVTTWGEVTTQATLATRWDRWRSLTGIYHHHFNNRVDRNHDNFMDKPLQKQFSAFQKFTFSDEFDMLLRYYYEDRLGGEMAGTHFNRHTGDLYVESIFTNRAEWLMKYTTKRIKPLEVWWSSSWHRQNSVYGDEYFDATQRIANLQTLWSNQSNWLRYTIGSALRYQYYNDNTTATQRQSISGEDLEAPDVFWMPALFSNVWISQGSFSISTGARLDHHPIHGFVPTGRVAFMYKKGRHALRALHGSAFRIVNLFAEEHAALTGAREVVVESSLLPERSHGQYVEWDFNLLKPTYYIKTTAGLFNNTFTNRILPDYDTDPQKIIFQNLDGKLIHRGLNVQIHWGFLGQWDFSTGGAIQDMRLIEDGKNELPPFVEQMNFQNLAGYSFGKNRIDLSSVTYSPMRLPLLGELDPRPEFSPWFSHVHVQYSFRSSRGFTFTVGIKNLFDFVPWRGLPSLIARADDPFDENVLFDPNSNPIPTSDNLFALTFDPTYAFTSLQGRRFFIHWTYQL